MLKVEAVPLSQLAAVRVGAIVKGVDLLGGELAHVNEVGVGRVKEGAGHEVEHDVMGEVHSSKQAKDAVVVEVALKLREGMGQLG